MRNHLIWLRSDRTERAEIATPGPLVIEKLPVVGDLPVIGALFRSNKFQRNQTELVIIVTPYVVHPTGPATPPEDTNSYVRVPSDADTVVYGRPAAVTRKAVRPPPPRVVDVDGLSFQ